jgi:hypothetical protein
MATKKDDTAKADDSKAEAKPRKDALQELSTRSALGGAKTIRVRSLEGQRRVRGRTFTEEPVELQVEDLRDADIERFTFDKRLEVTKG